MGKFLSKIKGSKEAIKNASKEEVPVQDVDSSPEAETDKSSQYLEETAIAPDIPDTQYVDENFATYIPSLPGNKEHISSGFQYQDRRASDTVLFHKSPGYSVKSDSEEDEFNLAINANRRFKLRKPSTSKKSIDRDINNNIDLSKIFKLHNKNHQHLSFSVYPAKKSESSSSAQEEPTKPKSTVEPGTPKKLSIVTSGDRNQSISVARSSLRVSIQPNDVQEGKEVTKSVSGELKSTSSSPSVLDGTEDFDDDADDSISISVKSKMDRRKSSSKSNASKRSSSRKSLKKSSRKSRPQSKSTLRRKKSSAKQEQPKPNKRLTRIHSRSFYIYKDQQTANRVLFESQIGRVARKVLIQYNEHNPGCCPELCPCPQPERCPKPWPKCCTRPCGPSFNCTALYGSNMADAMGIGSRISDPCPFYSTSSGGPSSECCDTAIQTGEGDDDSSAHCGEADSGNAKNCNKGRAKIWPN